MSDLSDIEEGPGEDLTIVTIVDPAETKKEKRNNKENNSKSKDNNSFNNNSYSNHTAFTAAESRTSKCGSCIMSIDPSVLELVTTLDAGLDDDHSVHEHKRANRFCGYCCDLVRACIIVNGFYVLKNINLIITIVLGLSYVRPTKITNDDDQKDYYDDDYYYHSNNSDDDKEQSGSMMFLVLMTKNIAGIIFATIGILAALNFQKWLLMSTIVWCFIDVAVSVLTERWLAAVSAGFFLYPEIALFWALHQGRITTENYKETVKYCCCSYCNGAEEVPPDEEEEEDMVDINLDDADDDDEE